MPKKFREYRAEAEALNDAAKAQGQAEPIPDAAKLRLRPLAHQVIQARITNGEDNRGGGRVDGQAT